MCAKKRETKKYNRSCSNTQLSAHIWQWRLWWWQRPSCPACTRRHRSSKWEGPAQGLDKSPKSQPRKGCKGTISQVLLKLQAQRSPLSQARLQWWLPWNLTILGHLRPSTGFGLRGKHCSLVVGHLRAAHEDQVQGNEDEDHVHVQGNEDEDHVHRDDGVNYSRDGGGICLSTLGYLNMCVRLFRNYFDYQERLQILNLHII